MLKQNVLCKVNDFSRLQRSAVFAVQLVLEFQESTAYMSFSVLVLPYVQKWQKSDWNQMFSVVITISKFNAATVLAFWNAICNVQCVFQSGTLSLFVFCMQFFLPNHWRAPSEVLGVIFLALDHDFHSDTYSLNTTNAFIFLLSSLALVILLKVSVCIYCQKHITHF